MTTFYSANIQILIVRIICLFRESDCLLQGEARRQLLCRDVLCLLFARSADFFASTTL